MKLKRQKRKAVDSLLGKLIVMRFYDHCIHVGNDTKPLVCRVCGWLVEETDTEYVLSHWLLENVDEETLRDNWEVKVILKSAYIDHEIMY